MAKGLEEEAEELRAMAKRIPAQGAWKAVQETKLKAGKVYMARRTWGKSQEPGPAVVCGWDLPNRGYGWTALFPKCGLPPTLVSNAGIEVWAAKTRLKKS